MLRYFLMATLMSAPINACECRTEPVYQADPMDEIHLTLTSLEIAAYNIPHRFCSYMIDDIRTIRVVLGVLEGENDDLSRHEAYQTIVCALHRIHLLAHNLDSDDAIYIFADIEMIRYHLDMIILQDHS